MWHFRKRRVVSKNTRLAPACFKDDHKSAKRRTSPNWPFVSMLVGRYDTIVDFLGALNLKYIAHPRPVGRDGGRGGQMVERERESRTRISLRLFVGKQTWRSHHPS